MTNRDTRISPFLQTLGPGLLWAGAAIGVSHLVQSTRAGAAFGFSLVWAVLLACIFKYPFFEFGPRYAAATGESLLVGYRRLGRWALSVFLVFTFGTMFVIMGAVTVVTAGLASQVFGLALSPVGWSAIILIFCASLLVLGKYPLLDKAIKIIIVLLTLSTLVAVFMAAAHGSAAKPGFQSPVIWSLSSFSFIIALMGWMPSAVDISVWHSLWSLERKKQTRHTPHLKHALLDFNIGYIGTTILALGFVTLGALVMYGTGEKFAGGGGAFANQFIRLYTVTLGEWSRPIILIAAFTTMFSTTFTVTDAYPRVLQRSTMLIFPELEKKIRSQIYYWIWMIILIIGALILLGFLSHTMTFLVDFATILSFLTAPVLAYINYRVVTSPDMPKEAQPKLWLRILSVAGLIFLTGFSIIFLVWRFG